MSASRPEIEAFLNSLTTERHTFTSSIDRIVSGDFLTSRCINKELVALAGVNDGSLFVVVKQGFQDRGIGKEIIKEVIEHCKVAGYSRIRLSVHLENKRAIALYTRFGFKRVFDNKEEGRVFMVLPFKFKASVFLLATKFVYFVLGNSFLWRKLVLLREKYG